MKNFCRTISKRVLLSLAAVCCSLAVVAQGKVTVSDPAFSGEHVEKEGIYYSLIDSMVTFGIKVEEGYTIEEQNWTLTCDEEVFEKKEVTANEVSFVADKAGVYKLTGDITLSKLNDKNEKETSNEQVTTPSVWVIAPKLLPEKQSFVVYTNEEFTIAFTDESDFGKNSVNGKWKIEWNVTPENNTVKAGDGLTFTTSYENSSETYETINAEYTATCKYLVAEKEICSTIHKFNADIYPKARIKGANAIVLNTAEEKSFDLSFEANGGYPGGWTYQWYLEDKELDSFAGNANLDTRNISFTPEAVAKTFNYKVVATNSYNENVWDTVEKTFTVNVFPVLDIKHVSASVLNFAGNKSIQHEVKTTGGYEKGWSYEWTRQGNKTGENSDILKYDEKSGKELNSVIYKVVATNNAENGDELGKREATFTVNVYPQPKVENPKEIFNYLVGDEVNPFVLNKEGGYPGGWEIKWKKDDVEIDCSEFSYLVTFDTTDETEKHEYTATVENKFGDETWYGPQVFTFEANRYPQISIAPLSELEFNTAQEKLFELHVKVEGGYNDGWTYQWKRNDKYVEVGNIKTEGHETTCSVKEKTPTNKNVEKITYKVIATNKAENGEQLGDPLEIPFKVNVYKKPEFYIVNCHEQVVSDLPFERSVQYTGGYDAEGAWTLTWRRNDAIEESRKNKTEKFTESYMGDGDYTEVNYTVHAVNKFGDDTWYDDTVEFHIRVYKPIELDYNVAVPGTYELYDEQIDLGVVYKGGVVESDQGSWTFEWINKTNPMAAYDNNVYSHNAENTTSKIRNDEYELIVRHFVDGDSIWGARCGYSIKSYPKAIITDKTKIDTVLCGGNEVKFGIKAELADVDGWKFEWKRDGELLSETSSILKYKEHNINNKERDEHTYVLHATNTHNDKVWVDTTYTYSSVVRPKLTIPEKCDYEVLLREGDNIELASTAGQGGYTKGWKYTWYNSHNFDKDKIINGQEDIALHNHTNDKEIKGGYDHNHMERRTEKYMLYVRNIDEIGQQVHYADTFCYEVTIHRRPRKPFKLVHKGNGSSNIYIVDMKENSGLTNNQLLENEYNFCFGYGDNEIKREDYTLRYQVYPKIGNADLPWVYSYWEYDNGYVCKSEKVECQTRAVSDEIVEDVIEVGHKGFKASLQVPMPANVRVMAFDGTVIKLMSYDEQVEFNEEFDLSGLSSGLYLIEICIGENREVKKIFVKE